MAVHLLWRPSVALISTRREYGWLFSIYVPIAAVVFGLVVGAILLAVLGDRGRSKASRRSENNRLEGTYAVLLTGVVGFLLYLTYTAEHKVDTVANRERPSLTVDVTAARWEWEFRYPRSGFVARSGTVGDQPLVVPENRAIRFNLSSQDVIHAILGAGAAFQAQPDPGRDRARDVDVHEAGHVRWAVRGVLRPASCRDGVPGAGADPGRVHALVGRQPRSGGGMTVQSPPH